MKNNLSILVLVAAIAFLIGVGTTYVTTQISWTSDMANQPSLKPQERPVAALPRSVPARQSAPRLGQDHPSMSSPPPAALQAASEPGPAHHAQELAQGTEAAQHHDEATGHAHTAADAHGYGQEQQHPHSADHPHPAAQDAQEKAGHHHAAEAVPHQHEKSVQTHVDEPAKPPHTDGHDHQHPAAQEHSADPAQHSANSPQGKMESAHPHTAPSDAHTAGTGHAHGQDSQQDGHGQDGHGMGHKATVSNPLEATVASISQGEQLFQTYCRVCHGDKGQGGMPIAAKYPKIPQFTTHLLRQQSEGHLYDMLSRGHGPMPGYAEALSSEERWHIINYLHSLQ